MINKEIENKEIEIEIKVHTHTFASAIKNYLFIIF
jgi:DNA-directed RNA polymerase subunit L